MRTLGSVILAFASYLQNEKRMSKNTSSAYVSDISLFFLTLQVETFESACDLSSVQTQLFFHKQKTDGITLTTLARKLSALKTFFHFTKKKFDITNTEIFKIKSFKTKQSIPRSIEKETFLKLARTLKTQTENEWEGLRDETVLYLIYSTGMRISEALSLKHNSINRRDGSVTITGKGQKQRVAILHKDILKRISQYLAKVPSEVQAEYARNYQLPPHHADIFLSKTGRKFTPRMFQFALANARNAIGLPATLTPHSMRHSFASHILENGGKIRVIQEALGHTSLKTTQKYLKVSDAALESAYNKFH